MIFKSDLIGKVFTLVSILVNWQQELWTLTLEHTQIRYHRSSNKHVGALLSHGIWEEGHKADCYIMCRDEWDPETDVDPKERDRKVKASSKIYGDTEEYC